MPRTDRETEYFKEDGNIHLQWLSNILTTYAVFHQEVLSALNIHAPVPSLTLQL